jgi:transcriptional regulator with XRE-family HTH domain
MSDVVKQNDIDLEKEDKGGGVFAVSENLGILLRHYRIKVKDWTLRELAEASQLSESYINRLEKNSRKCPSVPTVIRLADALGIPYDVLMATTFQPVENNKEVALADLLIQSNFVINDQKLSKEAKAILVKINEFVWECEWNANKNRDLYLLSEMIDEFKEAI